MRKIGQATPSSSNLRGDVIQRNLAWMEWAMSEADSIESRLRSTQDPQQSALIRAQAHALYREAITGRWKVKSTDPIGTRITPGRPALIPFSQGVYRLQRLAGCRLEGPRLIRVKPRCSIDARIHDIAQALDAGLSRVEAGRLVGISDTRINQILKKHEYTSLAL